MKSWYACVLMLIGGTVGCRTNEATPEDLLYRRWLVTQIQYANGQTVAMSSTNQWGIVAFTVKGMILYGDDGKYDPCCSPNRFNRKGATLDLVDVASISMPERTPNPVCALVDCAPIGSAWQIVTLTRYQLVIQQDRALVTYAPYP